MPSVGDLAQLRVELGETGNRAQAERLVMVFLEARYGRGSVAVDRSQQRAATPGPPSRLQSVTPRMVLEGVFPREASLLTNDHFVVEAAPGGLNAEDCALVDLVTFAFCDTLKKLSATQNRDPVTGLPGAESFQEQLISMLESETLLSLVMIDVDQFGAYNKQAGEQGGDALLRETALLLEETMRLQDSAFRLGGDEFGLLLPGLLMENAARMAERFREGFERRFQATGLGVSVGVSSFPDRAEDKHEFFKTARDALYAAWRAGGNRVALAPPRELPPE